MINILIYKIDFEADTFLISKLIGALPENIAVSVNKFLLAEDRARAAIGKALLALALKRKERPVSALNELRYTKYFKPYFGFDFYFNISHSSEYVVLAFSGKRELGIDIERIAELDLEDFSDQVTAEEMEAIALAESPKAKFFDLWTRKESVVKALGIGLHFPLKGINALQPAESDCGETPLIVSLEIDRDYKCSLAYFGEERSIVMEIVTSETLFSLSNELKSDSAR